MIAWAILWACGGAPTPLVPLPPQKVVLLGVDGATWKVMGPMIDAGELPNFARLAREGASMPQFGTMGTTHSPLVWTSVATGRQPEDHGVGDYIQTLDDGSRVPITSNARKVPAIWNIAGDHGLTVGVIGWWASWPAEAVKGYIISDHANPATSGWMKADAKYWTADPSALAALGADTWPGELSASLASHWIHPDRFPTEDFRTRSKLDETQVALAQAAPWNDRAPYSWLKTFYAVDGPHVAIARQLAGEQPVDLQMLYIRGPDPVQHYAWDLVEPERFARKPDHLERDQGIVQGIYRYVDSWLGEILADLGPETTLIVASDHGAEPSEAAPNPEREARPGAHTEEAKGVLFLYGPRVKPGHRIRSADPLDLMPTMAWLLGLPLSEELAGEPLTSAFLPDFVASRGQSTVPTYGPRPTAPPLPSPNDEVMLESLKALGYIE